MATKKDSTPKKKSAPKKEVVKLDNSKTYEFVATKESKHLKKGTVYTLNGTMAQLLIDKGLGSVK